MCALPVALTTAEREVAIDARWMLDAAGVRLVPEVCYRGHVGGCATVGTADRTPGASATSAVAGYGRILVAGAGGFIGGHLVRVLLERGYRNIRAVDCKPLSERHQIFPAAENVVADLATHEACDEATRGVDVVFNLAADMGGMGFIEAHKARCMLSVLINTHLLLNSRDHGVKRYFFASSACVYPNHRQVVADVTPLAEHEVYPALPEDGYGWEKLFSERMCRHFREDFGLETRVARLHNVYGPYGTYAGGREKAPAAVCRKVIEAQLSARDEIEIWGDGEQTRSFTYIDDCIHGILMITFGDIWEPLNLGSAERVSINQLVDLVEKIAGVKLRRRYRLDAPLGVRGRNSDNTLIRKHFGWEPSTPLEHGVRITYHWIHEQMVAGDRHFPGRVPR